MLLRRIQCENFLSYGKMFSLEFGPDLTVVTGPNGAGKSNLARCLDLGRAVIGVSAGDPAADRLDLYQGAGYQGAQEFGVRIELELDQSWERDLVRSFVCAAFATSPEFQANPDAAPPSELDTVAMAGIMEEDLALLHAGSLVVYFDSARSQPWLAGWEFSASDETRHILLRGQGGPQLRPGPVDPSAAAVGATGLGSWLMEAKQQGESVFDFADAVRSVDQAVAFQVSSSSGMPAVPDSLRGLASALGTGDSNNRSFGFDAVLSCVLQRGIVLTDNRRLPLQRRFPVTRLAGPSDLRDGSNVAAELYRLKNGDIHQRGRYAEVRAMFADLTGRELGLRAYPAQGGEGEAAIIIEPTVVDGHGERPLEFCGAGDQEALVLSTLLPGAPGRLTVLDEPAVNLEPAMQRRLTGKLKGPGQYLVITHSADLVPVDSAPDLARIARIAPGPDGSQVHRPSPHAVRDTGEAYRWLRMLEAAQVRGLLFASAVILCEGPTEVGALRQWWRDTSGLGLRDPEAANIMMVSVGGDSGFGLFIRYLDAFGIPWAIVADGPALRHNSKLAKQLGARGHKPGRPPADTDAFSRWRKYWERAGVFTLASKFGDGGDKSGEFEAFLERADPDLLAKARDQVGHGNKPLVGAYFAAERPDPPREVVSLYKSIAKRLPEIITPLPGGRVTAAPSFATDQWLARERPTSSGKPSAPTTKPTAG